MCVGWPMQILDAAEAAAMLSALHRVETRIDDAAHATNATHAMQATQSPPADAPVLARGRGRVEHVDLRLVGPCAPGDWVLVYQGAARERLDARRAAEIHAALDLLEQGLAGADDLADADPGFALPSAMSAAQLAALAGSSAAPSRPLTERSLEPSLERP